MADGGPPDDASLRTASTTRRRRMWRAVAAAAAIAVAGMLGSVGYLLFGGTNTSGPGGKVLACQPSQAGAASGSGTEEQCPPGGVPFTDGLVQTVNGGEFTIRTIVGGSLGPEAKLYVRKPDRAFIDVQHAQTHAALGQPVRVFTRKYEGREVVVYMEDSPLLK